MRFIFCALLAIGMSEGFMYLCNNYKLNDFETILIFVAYVTCVTKFTYIVMKEGMKE